MTAPMLSRGVLHTPSTVTELMRLAEVLAQSSLIPRDYRGKAADILGALLWGHEVGLGPRQALQGIAVVNGRPAIWGDAALALVRAHPACASIREGVEGEGDDCHGWCEVVRRGHPPVRRTFSVADAKRARLWGKTGPNGPTPWVTYPQRMLMLRARGFAIRDAFPDALCGVIPVEEAADIATEPRDVPNLAAAPAAAEPAVANPVPPASAVADAAGDAAPGNDNAAVISWRAMAWPICSRDGTCRDMGDPDLWEAEFAHRIRTVERHPKLSAAAKVETIHAVLAANREVPDWLRDERDQGAAVEAIEGLFVEALGADAVTG
ncbi:recombinase family protein [Paracraurococcus lichenis]|uniref:Phage recombination protein Bet n=1 Tax=Paracraurococcus lichenis TaxID=3064888 RepID=A0ABT9E999_9PROT|nr:hypothetical protein [Paracraurococcus sp. LOR1-02]MDO9712764.1 hypothetical protein [Paracraurococcus sp. LOR1-02]